MGLWHFTDADGNGVAWQHEGTAVSSFDDGLAYMPNEDGFDRTSADAFAKKLGNGVEAHLSGVPNWHARIEAETAEQAKRDAAEQAKRDAKVLRERQAEATRIADEAEAEAKRIADEAEANAAEQRKEQARELIERIKDPEGYEQRRQEAAKRAEYEALCEYATDEEKAILATAFGITDAE